MQQYRYENLTATAAETLHRFCRIKNNKTKKQLRSQKHIGEMTAALGKQRLDIYEVAGVEFLRHTLMISEQLIV